jgi:CRP/FNR family transcriptional regulator, anaerobic regulatory protein
MLPPTSGQQDIVTLQPQLRSSAATEPRSDELRSLDRIGSPLQINANQTIFSEGERVSHAYKMVSGVVRLCKHLPDGRRQIAQFLFPGDYFSFVAIGDHGFSAEAVGEVLLIEFLQKHVERLCQESPGLRARLFEMLSERVRNIQNHLTSVGRQTAKERVASFLVLLSERLSVDGKLVEVPMNRQDIADYLSLTMETVSRTLSLLRRTRIVDLPDHDHIDLKNLDALQALAAGVE